jgi:hypothetical protein
VILLQVTFGLHGDAGSAGVALYRVSGETAATSGVEFARRAFRPVGRLTGRFTAEKVLVGTTVSAATALHTELSVRVGGVPAASVALTSRTALAADASTAAPAPWWTLRSSVESGASLPLNRWLLPRRWSKPELGSASQLLAASVGSAAAPVNSVPPWIVDMQGRTPPLIGDTLRVDPGTWTVAPPALTYQWQRCDISTTPACKDIAGATGDRYVLAPRDAGVQFQVLVTARNDIGSRAVMTAPSPLVRFGALVTRIGVSNNAACGLQVGGSVVCWGFGDAIGDGTPTVMYAPPAIGIVSGLSDATAVDGGLYYSCALRATGAVVCWGHSFGPWLGNGSSLSSTPVAVAGLADATSISVGDDMACALRAGGAVACWGWNDHGDLGDGSELDTPSPVAVSGLHDAIAVSAGSSHTCALRADHTVVCWGMNWHGMLGSDPQIVTGSTTPLAVPGLSGVAAVDADGFFTCALLQSGGVVCWGDGRFGELGNGTIALNGPLSAVAGIGDAVAITISRYHACALRAGGSVACWGGSDPGQNDDGLPTTAVPLPVDWLADAVMIAGGGDRTYALRSDGSIVFWGIGDALAPHALPGL